MTKLTHAQFKEYLDDLNNEFKLCLSGKSKLNLPQESCIALIAAFISAKEEFNKVPDIGAELERWLDEIREYPAYSGNAKGHEIVLVDAIKNKIKELRSE